MKDNIGSGVKDASRLANYSCLTVIYHFLFLEGEETRTSLREAEHCVSSMSDHPVSAQSSTVNAGGHIESLCAFH